MSWKELITLVEGANSFHLQGYSRTGGGDLYLLRRRIFRRKAQTSTPHRKITLEGGRMHGTFSKEVTLGEGTLKPLTRGEGADLYPLNRKLLRKRKKITQEGIDWYPQVGK